MKFGLLLQHNGQQDQAVAQCARDRDRVEARPLIGQQVVPGDATAPIEILRVRAGMDTAHRDDEAHTICGGDISSAPRLGKRDAALRCHQKTIGSHERFVAQIVLVHPKQAVSPQRASVLP